MYVNKQKMKDSIREYRPKSSVLSKDSLMSKDGVEADLVNLRKVVVKSEKLFDNNIRILMMINK